MDALSQAMDDFELSTTSFYSNFLQNPPVQEQQRTTDRLRVLSDRLLIVLSKLHSAANAIAPSNKLPPELLGAIFSHLRPGSYRDWGGSPTSPYADLLAVSRVCRTWREIAVSATELWTDIILGAGHLSLREEAEVALLCVRRSGVRHLDFFHTSLSSFQRSDIVEAIPDRQRVRSVVSLCGRESSAEDLANFLIPASRLEHLEICGDGKFLLPTLFSGNPRCLRELVLFKCTPWPNNQFRSLTSFNLLSQNDIGADIPSLLCALQCSPHLEELLLENDFPSEIEPEPPEHGVAIPLHSLKRLHVGRLSTPATGHILGALDLLPNGISMRFSNIPMEFDGTFPEAIKPELSPRAATKLEIIYPFETGMILHATNGIAHTRWAHRYDRGSEFFPWVVENRHEACPLKELWLHIDRESYHEVPPYHALRDLETFVIETDPDEELDSVFFPMLSPDRNGIPSPRLSTLEIRSVFGVAVFGEILKARSDAGFRLETLRMMWFDGCEAKMVPLSQFVGKLEFYRVRGKASRGLQLPPECMTRRGRWEPWSRDFIGNTWDVLAD